MRQWQNELAEVLALDGEWTFRLEDEAGPITVPGAWEAQGYARRTEGPAFYERTVTVPAAWAGHRVQLQFDAVSYHAEVAVNGVVVGTHTGSWTAFAFDVTGVIHPGETNTIAVTVIKPGGSFGLRESLAGFLPDVALMFGGLWQSVRLVAFPGPALSSVTVQASVAAKTIAVEADAHDAAGLDAAIDVIGPDGARVAHWEGALDGDRVQAAIPLDVIRPWSPDDPARYTVEIALVGPDGMPQARARRVTGFRALDHQEQLLRLNGTPVCLRGALSWGWYPDLLCPAPDDATIRDEFRRVRSLGYNMVKLCLFVPSPRYFEIADEEGVLLWLELPLWLPEMTPHLRAQGPIEYADIAAQVHHHPSIVIYSLGCELERHVDAEWIAKLNAVVRGQVSDVLVCDNSGSGEAYGLEGDLADFYDYHFYADLQFFRPLVQHFHRDWRPSRPWIFGEFCDMDEYRRPDVLAAQFGGALPWWATEQNPIHPISKLAYSQQVERMAALDLDVDGAALEKLSRQQALAVRKFVLEAVRATDGMGGYVVTGLRNTPLSTSAMFDDAGQPKVDPAAFRRFNADTVLALGRGRARQWTRGGDRPAPAEPYNFAAGSRVALHVILSHAGDPRRLGDVRWHVAGPDGGTVAEGVQTLGGTFEAGRPRGVAQIAFAAPETADPFALRLHVALDTDRGTVENTWPLWIFPAVTDWPDGLALYDPAGKLAMLDDLAASAARIDAPAPDYRAIVSSALDGDLRAYLREGGRVLLVQQGDRPLPAVAVPFWRESLKLLADHPVMDAFPHDGYADVQFYGLATDWAFETDALRAALPEATAIRPLMRRLDARLFTLGEYLFEAEVGRGRLIASTLRFHGGLGDQPVSLGSNLAGRWLLARLIASLL
ncbi:glycoside hydrolase family 2 protein [Aggregatilinea lenta]|uniref:glycoside hydrolase family 2 protein n=1 Tax=Aggregatilinea lenta TaxID=913108 RepID=UPI000E5C06DB|nr:sugar-binding domain-containing protein [Aggregatilinea lenta]